MIPSAAITEWSRRAPWATRAQIEQDLILSRLIVEIAADPLLGSEFALRGGTCFHKLCLPKPGRYSEDLDYVRVTRSGIAPYMDSLRAIAGTVGLEEVDYAVKEGNVQMFFRTEPTDGPGRIRIKLETNVREVESFHARVRVLHRVESPWWEGAADVLTYPKEELMGTKLRALYQRNKGRDLFDLWLALTSLDIDDELVIAAHVRYIGEHGFSYPQLAINLSAKLNDGAFRHDLDDFIVDPGDYDIDEAADLMMKRLGSRLRNAPPGSEEVGAGGWRR